MCDIKSTSWNSEGQEKNVSIEKSTLPIVTTSTSKSTARTAIKYKKRKSASNELISIAIIGVLIFLLFLGLNVKKQTVENNPDVALDTLYEEYQEELEEQRRKEYIDPITKWAMNLFAD